MADDGERALAALAEIGQQRRLLDEAELNAVRAARQAQKSWAEIATKLGVTRQSAWEKWRDLDEDGERSADISEQILGRVVAGVTRHRKGTVAVPDVVGMSYEDARTTLVGTGFAPANADPDAPPLGPAEWVSWVVVRQYPDPGTRLRTGSQVRLWVERGGGSAGVREPRRPPPPVREISAEMDVGSVVGE